MNKKIIISSDHAGYELKAKLIEYYRNRGDEIVDIGAQNSKDSVSYATFGHDAANYYLQNKEDIAYGIGICGTGLGIGYALNRHNHIVAARVTSEEDACLAKKHNNANFLTFGGRQISFEEATKMIEEYESTNFEGGRHIARIDALNDK